MLEIRVDEARLREFERRLARIPRALPLVMSRGLNRTATQARTQISRSLAFRSGLKVGEVRRRTLLHRATYQNWRSAVTISRKRLSLRLLSPRAVKGGLSVKEGRRRVIVRRAFPALKGWFIRLPKAGGYKQTLGVREALEVAGQPLVGRLPIGRIRGPILAQVFAGAQDEADRIYRESLGRLEKNIHDQVQLILRKTG